MKLEALIKESCDKIDALWEHEENVRNRLDWQLQLTFERGRLNAFQQVLQEMNRAGCK